MGSHGDGEGAKPEENDRDPDLDLEKDAADSDSESDDSHPTLRHSRYTSPAAADAVPFLGSNEGYLHRSGRSTASATDAAPPSLRPAAKGDKRPDHVGWRDLPQKRQLIVITLARLSEPLVQTSLQVSSP